MGNRDTDAPQDVHVSPWLARLATWQLSRASARSHKVLHDRLAEADASGYDYRVLAVLGDLGPVSQAELGRAAMLDRRDVTHTVRALQARRLVARQPDPRDARRMLVALTTAGRAMLARLDLVIDGVQREVFGALTADERRTLLALLQRLS